MTAPWFQMPRDEMGKEVDLIVDGLKSEQGGRRAEYIKALELYEGRRMAGYTAHSYAYIQDGLENAKNFEGDRLRLVRSAVSTATANIYAAQKPKPQFQTQGATWATRRKAYRLDRICEGILNQRQERWINVWAFMIDASVDTALQGVAAIWVTANKEQKKIDHELVPLPDIFTDPGEGRNPKNLFWRRPIDEQTALERFPKAAKAIKDARAYEWYGGRGASDKPRATKVIEIKYAVRLPLSKKKPGLWCAVINGTVVDSGPWTAPAFPFVFFMWEPHRDGPWASGIAAEGGGLAQECGELNYRLLAREVIGSGKKIFYEAESLKPDDLALNDAVVAVAVQKGAVFPTEHATPAFAPADLQFQQYEVQLFWDAIGVSQVSAAARREPGIDSGVAQMTLNDTKAGRQLIKSQRYEQAYVDLAHQYVWRMRELAKDDPGFSMTWPGKALIRQYKWKDADLDDDLFSVTVAPASALPHDPAGRQAMVQQMLRSGLISQETAKTLIGWPDLDAELNIDNAEGEYVDSLIELYLDAEQETWDAGDYQAPTGFMMNKVNALRRFASAWFRGRIDQQTLPPEEKTKAEFNLQILERYLKELDALMQPPPAAPGTGAPAGAPAPVANDQTAALPLAPVQAA